MEFDINTGVVVDKKTTSVTAYPNELQSVKLAVAELNHKIDLINSTFGSVNRLILGIDERIKVLEGRKEEAAPETADDKEIGNIVISSLTPAQFYNINGSNWKICDGSSCVGTRYHVLTNRSTVPDFRGMFLRGVTMPISGGVSNPNSTNTTNSTLLGYQDNAMLRIYGEVKHVSESVWNRDTPVSTGAFTVTKGSSSLTPKTVDTSNCGNIVFDSARVVPTATEVRPKNVGVNYFIKINRDT